VAARERVIEEKIERQRSAPGQGDTSWGNSRAASRHTSRAPSEAGDVSPAPLQILSRGTDLTALTEASTSGPSQPKEKEIFGSRAPPPPTVNKTGPPAGERRTSTSGPSTGAGGLKPAFSFAKAAGGGSSSSSGSGADAPGAWGRKGSVGQ
jgi:hypothetical protein